jgi:aspartyl-tRNA(Asn)/glutamyl-tRNA(Gln) amidotransferase subunit C
MVPKRARKSSISRAIRYIARMSHMTREEVERIAHLARLRLAEEEAVAMASQLESILGYIELLDTLDTSQVEPTSHVMPLATPMREDRPGTSYPPETAIANAPARDGSAFAVPKVLEGEDEG